MSDDPAQGGDQEDGDDNAKTLEEENQTEYEAVVHLKPVLVDSGEKDEDVIYKQRCALYRFVLATDKDPAQWKERGKGDIRFLQNKASKVVRIVLREEKTLKLRLNQIVQPGVDLKPNPGSDRFWAWRNEDYAEDPPITDTFGIKFKTPDIANEFKAKWEESQKANSEASKKKPAAAAAAPAPAAAATAAAAPAKAAEKTADKPAEKTATPAKNEKSAAKKEAKATPAKAAEPAPAKAAEPAPAAAPAAAAAASPSAGGSAKKKKKKKSSKKKASKKAEEDEEEGPEDPAVGALASAVGGVKLDK